MRAMMLEKRDLLTPSEDNIKKVESLQEELKGIFQRYL